MRHNHLMMKSLAAYVASLIATIVSLSWFLFTLIADNLGRLDVTTQLLKPDTTFHRALAALLNAPLWLPGMLTIFILAGWFYAFYFLLNLQDRRAVNTTSSEPTANALGGRGGGGTIYGDAGTIIGGKGGDGGLGSRGGDGGGGHIVGHGGLLIGGDGGNAGQADGRGGRATAPNPIFAHLPMTMWGAARGGPGANTPEYNRRLALLITIRRDYMTALPDTQPFIESGVDQIPAHWVNARLLAIGEKWQVTDGARGYILPPIA